MKRRQKATWFLAGILASAILSTSVLPTLAATVAQKLTVHTGVKVYVDDVQIDPGDTHGNPDAFIYNGTTYVAVAAVSNSLGENVKWDGNTTSVYIGKHEGSKSYLLNVCPPYETRGYSAPATMTMSGKKYANGFCTYGYALFNLDGKYDTLSFDIGHRDGANMFSRSCNIYLDGELAFSIDLDPEMMPEHYEIPLDGAVQMKIETDPFGDDAYGIANIQVS